MLARILLIAAVLSAAVNAAIVIDQVLECTPAADASGRAPAGRAPCESCLSCAGADANVTSVRPFTCTVKAAAAYDPATYFTVVELDEFAVVSPVSTAHAHSCQGSTALLGGLPPKKPTFVPYMTSTTPAKSHCFNPAERTARTPSGEHERAWVAEHQDALLHNFGFATANAGDFELVCFHVVPGAAAGSGSGAATGPAREYFALNGGVGGGGASRSVPPPRSAERGDEKGAGSGLAANTMLLGLTVLVISLVTRQCSFLTLKF